MASADYVPYLAPETLSVLPLRSDLTGVFLVGYDEDNPPKLVRVDVSSGLGGGPGVTLPIDATDVDVSGTPTFYTPTDATSQGHFEGLDASVGAAAAAASAAETNAAAAVVTANDALDRTNHTGLQASTTVTQSQLLWTDTPSITAAADVNGKLIQGSHSSGTAKTITLIAGIAADTWFAFSNINSGVWKFVGDATSVVKTSNGVTVWTSNAGNGVTIWGTPGAGSCVVVSEGSNTWRIYQSNAAVHVGADSLADDTYDQSVPVHTGRFFGETVAQWEVVYLKSDGKFWLADADAAAPACDPYGIAVSGGAADAAATILRRGFVRNDGWNWSTVGAKIYLSATPGALTQTEPNTLGNGSVAVGVAHTDDEAFFDFSVGVRQPKPIIQDKISFNPKAVCDGTIDRLFLFNVDAIAYPNGVKFLSWYVSWDADPTTEADLDFKRADAFIGVANSAVMDVLDTTAGVSSETTAANINSGAVVVAGKVVYLEFGAAYTTDLLQLNFSYTFQVM